MEFNKNYNLTSGDYSENINLNVKGILEKYLRSWQWILLSIIICVVFMYVKLNFTRSQYKAETTIKLKDEKGDNSTLDLFKDLGVMSGSNDKIEDEIEILRSKGLIAETIKSLEINVQIFTNKNSISNFFDDKLGFNTDFYEKEKYVHPPIKINFFISDSALYNTNAKFFISINSADGFDFIDQENDIRRNHVFGERIETSFGDIIIIPNINFKENEYIGSKILVTISSIRNLTDYYAKIIKIEPKSEFSSVLSLSLNDPVKKKAEDFLSELVNKYNQRAITLKDELAKSTSDFVNSRLEIISNELSDVDLDAESLKTRYAATSNSGINMQSGQAIENQIVTANMQLQQIESMKDFVVKKDDNELIPLDVGVADKNVSTTINQYNQLMMQKKRILENSTNKNPIVVNLNEQLIALKNNIDEGLNNLEMSQKISVEALERQDARINSRLYSAPRQERQIRDVQRQQGIKEALYLYLLQKREETAITLGVKDPNAKIIDYAQSSIDPVSPKKKIYYLATLLVGILIPVVVISVIDFFDTKVKTREEIQQILNIPVLGDIPKLETKTPFLISKDDHSSVAEAFRILRTNLNFLLPHSNNFGKTIFITSTIAHEGKSLVATNLAASLVHAGKKTILIGMDIRAPKIMSYLGIKGDLGVTNFIINPELYLKDIVLTVPKVENLDLISSGDIAPNPAELLMSSRVKELFDEVKLIYDYIIVDTAASSVVTDTMLLTQYADAFVYVIRANYLDKRRLGYIHTINTEKKLPNMALVINGVDHKKSYGYGYGYGYGKKFEKSNKKVWWKLSN